MSARRIIEAFESWRESARPIVLATVFETLGSTYSKPGHRILIRDDGDYQGLVSGGCLEGDVALHARRVLETSESAVVSYDLRDEADEVWGLGVGCNGLIRIFLQPLQPESGYEPFASMAEVLRGPTGGSAATIIKSSGELPAGATLVRTGGASPSPRSSACARDSQAGASRSTIAGVAARDSQSGGAPHLPSKAVTARRGSIGSTQAVEVCCWQLESAPAESSQFAKLAAGCAEACASGQSRYLAAADFEVLFAPLRKIPRLLVLGAGLDALPIIAMAGELGWYTTLADHRPVYLRRSSRANADVRLVVEPGQLRRALPLEDFDGVLVMSHHLATDRAYLQELADLDCRYLGLLGPPARKDRLLSELGTRGGSLGSRLRGPVGLDLGADSPEAIALSILAEMQAVLSPRSSAFSPPQSGRPDLIST